MTDPTGAKLARRQLDSRLAPPTLRDLATRPPKGWVRAIRDALGMTSQELARRMGQSQPSVTKLERSEADDSIRLGTLRRAADALNCDLVYALVPRTSLEQTVRDQARAMAVRDVGAVHRSMQLEDQSLRANEVEQRIEEYAAELIAQGALWRERS